MNLTTLKYWLPKILWLFPIFSMIIYFVPVHRQELLRRDVFVKNYQNVVLHHLPKEIQMPAISICSFNQYSYRDADKVLEIPKWYNINYNHTKFMSIFRNFAHHKMDPNEVENFTQEQKDFLFYHRGAFTKIIRKQVVPSCDELILYCNLNGVQRNCTDLFRIRSSLDGICCTLDPHKVPKLKRIATPNLKCLNHSLINDGHCQLSNFNEGCSYDGSDCCPNPYAIGNDYCDLENNIKMCNFDGGDCCLIDKIGDGFCDSLNFNRMCRNDEGDCTCQYNLIGNGQCDEGNNKQNCEFDAGDCCVNHWIGDGFCDKINLNSKCGFDGGDCCTLKEYAIWIGDGFCDDLTNRAFCNFDGGDCCLDNVNTKYCSECICWENHKLEITCPYYKTIGDGICDDVNNNAVCQYDGGDCCLYNVTQTKCDECLCIQEGHCDPCPSHGTIADGQCNEINNNLICSYDGEDCYQERTDCKKWLDPITLTIKSPNYPFEYGNNIRCGWDITAKPGYSVWLRILDYDIWPYGFSLLKTCPNPARIGDGRCDLENHNKHCNFDGGDCCPNIGKIDDKICDEENLNEVCGFDGLDCCQNRIEAGNKICNLENNNDRCYFDLGDCCRPGWAGNGICNEGGYNNNPFCGPYDGGDCCIKDPILSECTDGNCQCHEDAEEFKDILAWPNDTLDQLIVYDGKNRNASVLRKITGRIIQGDSILIKSTKRDLFISFQSDSVLSARGFRAIFSYMPLGVGGISFCSTSELCEEDQGNCDSKGDHQCAGGLKCGVDNCPPNLEFEHWVNCCYQPWWKSCTDSLNIETRTLVSPQYPSRYDINQHCTWLIQVNGSSIVTLNIDWIALSATYSYDALRLYDGNSSNATLLAEISGGYHYNIKILSTGPQMFITFDSDDYADWSGFYATFKEESIIAPANELIKPCSKGSPCHTFEGQCYHHKQCSGSLRCGKDNCQQFNLKYGPKNDCCYDYCDQWWNENLGIISSPEYPSTYNPAEDCTWTITAGSNQTVLLEFLDFGLQCDSTDYVKLFDGNSTEKDYLMRDLLGGYGTGNVYIPSDVQSVSNQLTVKFFTDGEIEDKGFKAKVRFINGPREKAVNACSVDNPCGVDQGHCFYDGQCLGNLRCGEKNCHKELGYDYDSNCCYDFCSQWLDMDAGTLTSPNYPSLYENMITCSWLITSSSNDSIIKIEFNPNMIFSLTQTHQSNPDYLRLYDGNSEEAILLGTLFGKNIPSKIKSSGQRIFVTFTTDHFAVANGFSANIIEEPKPEDDPNAKDCSIANPCESGEGHCQSDFECKGAHRCGENNCPIGFLKTTDCCYDYCGKCLDMQSGTLVSPNYPDKYDNNEECKWLLVVAMTVAGPRTMTLEFIKFALKPPYDTLKTYDGNSADFNLISSNSGFDVPPNVTSSTNEMLVAFYSDPFIDSNGFYINIYEHPHYCEQWIDYKKGTIKSPTFPDEKTNKLDCSWLITADEGFSLTINIEHFHLTRSLEGVTYFDGPTNRSRVIWEDNGFLHPFRFNRSSTGNSMLITFRSEWRLPRSYGFFFRIYCNPPTQGSARSYNTKPEFCLSKSVIKSKVNRKCAPVYFQKDQDWIHPSIELKSKVTKSGLLKTKANLNEYRFEMHHERILHGTKPTLVSRSRTKDELIADIAEKHQKQPSISRNGSKKSLGNDLDQLTKDNHHELKLSPYPSLTLIVQPNKIDYTERIMPRPLIIKLIISGEARSEDLRALQGIYHLQDELVNNHPCWNKIDGSYAMWFGNDYVQNWPYPWNYYRRWYVGLKNYMGRSNGNITGPLGIDISPTQISRGWRFYSNNDWIEAGPSEIIFQDISPKFTNFGEIKNNGGFRIFVHRPFIPPTDPKSAVFVDKNSEAFVNVDYKREYGVSANVQTLPCWHTVHQWNLWFDIEVEIVDAEKYSREGCVHEWQAKTLFRICKCLPYYYTEVFDWWWAKTLRCNHIGLKCFALVNSTSYLHNSTWGNSDKAIQKYCPAKCGQREFNISMLSQARIKNNSWYINWLKSKGNRLYDLENQIVQTDTTIYTNDYALMEEHYHNLAYESSIVHFYFDDLYREKHSAIDVPPPMVSHFECTIHFWIGFTVAMMLHYMHKLEIRFLMPYLASFLSREARVP